MIKKIVIVSGGFDPIHIGHVRMIQTAIKMGDRVIIIVNNDVWIKQKKGYVFMPENERYEIVQALCRENDGVLLSFHKQGFTDRSVCEELKYISNNFNGDLIFTNGGDRLADNVPEVQLCKELNIAMVFNVGGKKIQSSSDLVKNQKEKGK